jgi:hypothetical protein
MVAARWVEVVAVEASASGGSGVALESSVTVSETEGATLALACNTHFSQRIKKNCANRSAYKIIVLVKNIPKINLA